MKRGDIWMVDLNPVVGRELRSDSPRPVLIVSPMDFTKKTGLAWVVPITRGGVQSRNAGFAISLTGFGLQTDGVIRCEMLRAVDLQARGATYVETAPDILVDQALGMADSVLA